MRTLSIIVLIGFLLVGCASPAAAPTATPVPASATATLPPTPTPVPPTATQTATATAVPATATATHVPPTATATQTPTLGPGGVAYHTDFDNFSGWKALSIQPNGKLLTEIHDGRLSVNIKSRDTFAYIIYKDKTPATADMAIETVAQRGGGTNRNNITLVCRISDKGWYEFTITSGGLYNIMRFDADSFNWTYLATGGSEAIQMQDKPNKLKAICQGDTLSLVINDQTVATAHDSRLTYGTGFGLSVSAYSIGNVTVEFDYVTVTLP